MNDHTNCLIRPAHHVDFSALKRVLRETYASTWRPQITEAAAAEYDRVDPAGDFVNRRGTTFWVAEIEGEIAGLVDWEGDFINALHVRPAHARTGLGAALMDKAEAEIAAAGHAQVRLETDTFNTASQAFYAARGYIEKDRYPDLEWKSGLTTLLLVKPIGHARLGMEETPS